MYSFASCLVFEVNSQKYTCTNNCSHCFYSNYKKENLMKRKFCNSCMTIMTLTFDRMLKRMSIGCYPSEIILLGLRHLLYSMMI